MSGKKPKVIVFDLVKVVAPIVSEQGIGTALSIDLKFAEKVICFLKNFSFNRNKKMSEKKPKVVVFDLDYTLWPYWANARVTPPFKKGSNDKVVDAYGKHIPCYPDSPEILKKLHEDGVEIGIASSTGEIEGTNQLLNLFGWDKYIKYKEIYPGAKTTHLSKIKNDSGVEYKDMIFFDDGKRNIRDLTEVGVFSILIRDGVKHKDIADAFKQFASKRSKKKF